jgi:hypothetical protein
MEIYNLQLVTEQFTSNIIHLQLIMQKGASGIKRPGFYYISHILLTSSIARIV